MGSQVPGPVDSLARSGKQQMVMQASTVYNYQLLMKTLQQPFEMKLKEAAMAQINMDSTNRISTTARRITKGQVPDVTGMALKDAVYILEQQGLHIQVSGKGAIQSQSIPPGSQVVKGQTIIIQLS
jgi:cell division protein FtsI (penicillin-binding protein 3)